MVCRITPTQLAEILAVTPPALSDSTAATGIATDTRSLKAGEIFLALRGENFDGHKFVGRHSN